MFSTSKLLSLVSFAMIAAAAAVQHNEARQFSGTNTGDGTFFEPGLGACGINNGPNDPLVAISSQLYDSFPGATPNPNNNPVCQRTITASFGGNTVTVPVRDRCTGCAVDDLDFSPATFQQLAPLSVGRIHGVQWHFN